MRTNPLLPRSVTRQRGASLPEYALLLALIMVVCMNAVRSTGIESRNTFQRVQLASAQGSSNPRFDGRFTSRGLDQFRRDLLDAPGPG